MGGTIATVCNTAPAGCPVSFTSVANEIGADGWAQLSPYGDFPCEFVTVQNDGSVTRSSGIQRIDRACAEAMARKFNSLGQRVNRWIKGLSIFLGHPDKPGAGDEYPDKTEKGLICELQVRDDGLYGRPVFNAQGGDLLDTIKGLAFSPCWSAEIQGEENSKTILRPTLLISAGLTKRPNLPVTALNEMNSNLPLLIAALRRHGATIEDSADEAAFVRAVDILGGKTVQAANDNTTSQNRITGLNTDLNSEKGKTTELEKQLAAERAKTGTLLFNAALAEGRVNEAQRETYKARFIANQAGAESELALEKKDLKTQPQAKDLAGRSELVGKDVATRARQVQVLVNARMKKEGEDYDTAYAAVFNEQPALFGIDKK